MHHELDQNHCYEQFHLFVHRDLLLHPGPEAGGIGLSAG